MNTQIEIKTKSVQIL